ncbi:DNA ligase 1-like protein [Cinnamomum micranthum f. kanehirae]|uniref:DNA ligase 1-like protein n=1 Tax=Cinnamomum micranthum f. kanehirae TaxID=337451 RepID=A0A443NIU5_9MAGN|nr:DNA ligase 1-like protein [Cinnamomum micranthum f. kanehirae]
MFTFLEAQAQKEDFLGRRLLATHKEEISNKKTSLEIKNQTKPIKSIKKTINSTTKATTEKKNQFKLAKSISNSTTTKTTLSKTKLKNHTSNSNSSSPTKPKSISFKKSLDLLKSSTPKNKTTSKKQSQPPPEKKSPLLEKSKHSQTSSNKNTAKDHHDQKIKGEAKSKIPTLSYFNRDADETDDFISEFRDLPYKFHETILPDLEKISTTSKAYISRANQEITQGFKPLVGNKYASIIASLTSCIFLILPLLLVSLLFNQIKTYISLQKILIFIQVYLAIYFLILSLAYFATGLEPLKFFYTTSTSSYITMQVFQTLGYVLYLLMQLLNLVVVFSTMESGLALKFLGLGQMIVGLAVGLHYYTAVFHRAVVGKPPKTNWKIHGIYATCFLVICLFVRAERRKKTYLQEDGGDDGKKS